MIRRTQVAIIGAGPAGLLLSHLLAADGVESVVLETLSREYVGARIRAGILETSTVEVLAACGLDRRLRQQGFGHRGIYAWHPEGFALPLDGSEAVSRLYLQVPQNTEWSDDQIWDALALRLGHGQNGWELHPGPIIDRSVLPMRS